MTTVYLVSSGEYSDYGIDAVFSDQIKAQRYIDTRGDSDSYRIEPYELDADVPPERLQYIAKRFPGADMFRVYLLDSPRAMFRGTDTWVERDARGRLIWTSLIDARDKSHATKIASERWM